MPTESPEQQLDGFIARYTPAVAAIATEALPRMRARLCGALELVYDNYNALAIGFSPTERAGDVIASLALYPKWVSLFLFRGVELPDPHQLLRGSGKGVRHIVLDDGAAMLDRPEVVALLQAALEKSVVPLNREQPHRIFIKSISPKQRPRRPSEKNTPARAPKPAPQR